MNDATARSLFIEYSDEIKTFLTRRINCPDTAADLTQEVFLRFMRAPDKQGKVHNMRAYLYKTAANIATNHFVDERRRQDLWKKAEDASPEQIETRTPESITYDGQRLKTVATALKELSPLAQQIFILTRIKGMKQQEVATKLDVHITTVEKNLSKAVRHCYASIMDSES